MRLHPALLIALLLPAAARAQATHTDSGLVRPHGAKFTGTVASIRTTQGIPDVDIRLIYVDSVVATKSQAAGGDEVFVDSTRSRIAITDVTGNFTVRDVAPGHYLINVRRLGFEPFEGVLTIDTASVEMELGMNQLSQLLPPIRITASAENRVVQRLDRVGFVTRSRMGTSGRFIDRGEILQRKAVYLTDILQTYGLSIADSYTVDRIPMDWGELRDYPIDMVIGIEIYRHRGTVPVEFGGTQMGGRQTFSNDRGTPMVQANVLIWTYIP